MRYLLVTIAVAVALSVGMWIVGVVAFNGYTFGLHVVSIYIGVAAVLAYQIHRERRRGR